MGMRRRTWTGKWICTASLTWGLFLFALLVDYVHQLMQLDKDEIDAAHWVQAYKVQKTRPAYLLFVSFQEQILFSRYCSVCVTGCRGYRAAMA